MGIHDTGTDDDAMYDTINGVAMRNYRLSKENGLKFH